jgi:hypothetical protein
VLLIPTLASLVLAGSIGPSSATSSGSTGSTPWQTSTATHDCAASLHLLVPTQTPAYFAQHPAQLLVDQNAGQDQQGFSALLNKIAAANIHYKTSLSCAEGHNGQPIPAHTRATGASSDVQSDNWSGYVSPQFTENWLGAEMEWNVPLVNEPSNLTVVSSVWPGIGTGDSDDDTLVQAGTEQDGICVLECVAHTTDYYFWLELFPQESQEEITNLTANPRDNVAAIVEYNPAATQAFFQLDDFTTGQGVYAYQDVSGSPVGSGSQVEWILERTSEHNGLGDAIWPSLDDYGVEGITNAAAASGPDWSDVTTDDANSSAVDATPWDIYDCAGLQLDQTDAFNSSTAFDLSWLNYGPTDPVGC